MNETSLGTLRPVEPRTLWRDEAADFTPWLAHPDNITRLGEAIGLELEVEHTEVAVGPGSLSFSFGGENAMASSKQPGPMCQVSRPVRVEDGTMCRMATPLPGPVGASASPVARWTVSAKLLEAARRAAPKLPAESREQFAALFSPTNIEITAGVLAVWGASHFFGVGEVADVVLLGFGVVTMGTAAFGVGRNLGTYLSLAVKARTEADLDRAATHLAQAVVTMGVVAFIALIMKAGSRLTGRAGLVGGVASEAEETVTVGRWMSEKEYAAMVRAGRVQESPAGGAKGVLYPPNRASYKAAPAGDIYVEFDVPKSSLEGKSLGQSAISGPNSPRSRLAVQKGLPPLQMPPATNVRIVGKK